MAAAPESDFATASTIGGGAILVGRDETTKASSSSLQMRSNNSADHADNGDDGDDGNNIHQVVVTDDEGGDDDVFVPSPSLEDSNIGEGGRGEDDADAAADALVTTHRTRGGGGGNNNGKGNIINTNELKQPLIEVPQFFQRLPRKSRQHGKNDHADLSLEEEWVLVDRIHKTLSKGVLLCWLFLVAFCYWIVPEGSIQWYTGAERNAALVNLSILTTAVVTKHIPLLWEMNIKELSTPSSSSKSSSSGRRRGSSTKSMLLGRPTQVSGILAGGIVTQFIAIMTAAIMVCFPVPVMVDPILGSRVHLIRWCEWTPCAGFMTLMMDLVDAPQYDGTKFTHPWKTMFVVAAMESISSSCALIFPFCTNFYVWLAVMILSCVTYSAVLYRNYEKRRLFAFCRWRGGRSVDEIELYERARTSLALNFVCSVVWTMIVIAYFVTSCGHLVLSERWTLFHDPAITMISECSMDLLAKWLFMSLIVDAHNSIFDESKRAKRRLAELRNMMSVVWENSSDTIAISVRKLSGNVTSMVSPSFFRSALTETEQDKIQDISAVVLEHSSEEMKWKREPSSKNNNTSGTEKFPDVAIEFIRKADFDGVDFHFADNNVGLEYTWHENKAMTFLVVAFTDMLARAWQDDKSEEILFEYDASSKDGGKKTKFEVTLTRLEGDAIVLVVRNVSERYQRFEAEKRFIFETTARQRDAEANRFTRHEVKNGILAAIEICGNLHDQLSNNPHRGMNTIDHPNDASTDGGTSTTVGSESLNELDHTLREVLDIILAGTMARDIINGIYVPRMEHIDLNSILGHTRGFKVYHNQLSFVSTPSPLPILLTDPALFKCIHGNAIRNALKYGKMGGEIKTEAKYDHVSGIFEMSVVNLPGLGHEKLVDMGSRASELVFSHGTRLHKDSALGKRFHSAGDGAWIISKCASILGGKVDIQFEVDRTVFWFQAPIKLGTPTPHDVAKFHLPPDVWGIGIDDSVIQRKLLRALFAQVGIPESRQIILGENAEEIVGFVNRVVDIVNRHSSGRFFLVADENFEISDSNTHAHISGSECIKIIRTTLSPEQEKRMLALVRSANDCTQDLALYRSKAHGVMSKVPLRGTSVRESVYSLWRERFPEDTTEDSTSLVAALDNISDIPGLTSVSSVELLSEVEQIDNLCVQNPHNSRFDQWHVLWDKLHKLMGDLKSVNDEDTLTEAINSIEALRDGNQPAADFMSTWMQIRSDVVSFISMHE